MVTFAATHLIGRWAMSSDNSNKDPFKCSSDDDAGEEAASSMKSDEDDPMEKLELSEEKEELP